MARRLSFPRLGFLRASAFASLTASGQQLGLTLAPLDLLTRRHALALSRRGHECIDLSKRYLKRKKSGGVMA